jgi:hypothetical protein
VLYSDKFYYLADHAPPKDIPHAFFFNIDNVPVLLSRYSRLEAGTGAESQDLVY